MVRDVGIAGSYKRPSAFATTMGRQRIRPSSSVWTRFLSVLLGQFEIVLMVGHRIDVSVLSNVVR